ncbi:MAG: PQQ-binding-like beta-propeller repeat protein, partial [Thermomicrobiales bacterium]
LQIGPAPEEESDELWRAPTGWHSDAQPVVARGLVYFGGYSLGERLPILVAVDAATGGVRWQTSAPVAWAEFPDAPALGGDILFAPVQAPVAGVLAVVATSGEPLWFAPFGFTSVTAPAVDADAVYVAGWGVRNPRDRAVNDASGAVFALDQRTGRERWRFLAGARFGAVSVGPETVYVPSDRGLFALDRASGRKRWQARFSPGAGETATVAAGTIVFAGSEITSGKTGVFALDAASGALRWRVDLPAAPGVRAGIAAANDHAYVSWWEAPPDDPGSGAPTLRAYELETGEEQWIFRVRDPEAPGLPIGAGTLTSPVVVGASVLFGVAVRTPPPGAIGNADGFYAVDNTSGALRWRAAATTPIRSAPAVLDGVIYAMGGLRPRGGATGGNLFAFAAG